MIEFPEELFAVLESPLWLLDQQQSIKSKSQGALRIEQSYQLDIHRIIAVSQGESCARHPEAFICADCALNRHVSPAGFPFVLRRHDGVEVEFWGQWYQKDSQSLLQITLQQPVLAPAQSMFGYLNDAREAERKKIAQDLHDGVAQSIYSLMLETRMLKWLTKEQQSAQVKTIDQHFAEILRDVKNIAGELRPMTLDEFGLVPALEQFIERTYQMTGFEIDMTVSRHQQPLKESVRVAIYRMIQEAVTNAMKYSGTNVVELRLDFGESLEVTIQDEGIGFDDSADKLGFGLRNMKERAAAIAGKFYITSKPNQGTTLSISVPLIEHQKGCKEGKENEYLSR